VIVNGFTITDEAVKYMGADDAARFGHRLPYYTQRVREEAEQLRPWLKPVESFLDIGCGLGLIDALIAEITGAQFIHMMDGTGDNGNRVMGYNDGTKAWADVHVGAGLVAANTTCAVHAHVADHMSTIPVNLIVSFKSWAHHYPVETYLPLALRSLKPGGRVIVDLRNGKGGREVLEANGFKVIGSFIASPKCVRTILERT
jgi:SAM-dependent methyltransferase